jgi:predicted phage replisome organizer/uncharacterized phage protein (TIGR02220 family)
LNVHWIKISTAIFDDEKIKLIDALPERDAVFTIWVKLLVLAGRINDGGKITLGEAVPYTDEMLSAVFNRPLNTVRLAIETFRKFRMIETIEGDVLFITNWEKHQAIDWMNKVREEGRLRVAKHRAKQKLLPCNVTVTESNATDLDLDLDLEKNKKDKLSGKPDAAPVKNEKLETAKRVIDYLNECTGKHFRHSPASLRLVMARMKEGHIENDFRLVIDYKVHYWFSDLKMKEYLRPHTLFGTKFESYRQEVQ